MAGTCESRNQNVTSKEGEQTDSTVKAPKEKKKQHKHKAANVHLLC